VIATKGALDVTYFLTVSGDSDQGTAAHGQFLFNTTTHTLLWDADGAGVAADIKMATFKIDLALGGMVVV